MHHPAMLFPVQGTPPFPSSTMVTSFLFYTLDTRYFFFSLPIFSPLLLCLFFHTLYISPYSLLHYFSISIPLNNFYTIYSSASLQRQNHVLGFLLSWYLYNYTSILYKCYYFLPHPPILSFQYCTSWGHTPCATIFLYLSP